eukprot:867124-Pyramimonas_sp.AAC.1
MTRVNKPYSRALSPTNPAAKSVARPTTNSRGKSLGTFPRTELNMSTARQDGTPEPHDDFHQGRSASRRTSSQSG